MTIPIINQKCIRNGVVDFSQVKYTDPQKKIPSDKILQDRDILINSTGTGTLGRVSIYHQIGQQCTVDSHVTIVRSSKDIDATFLGYNLINQQYNIESLATGSTGQTELPRARLASEIEILLPPLDEQRRIAGILGSLDDKIELNRRINANLEAQAQALFRSWFVDFEPFRDGPFVDSELGKIPQGWKICRLKDATKEIIRGFTSKYVEKSDLINLNQKVNKGQYLDRQYYKFLNPEIAIPTNKFAQQNDILLNSLGQGTLGRVHYYGELTPNIVIDQHITIIRANNTTFQPSFIYLFLSSNEVQHSIEGMVTGSTGMQMLNISQVREMNILQPDVNTMNKFHNIVQPFFVEIRKNNAETEIIAKIRDTLLPKLMAGEIKI
ncbi:MAG: restriction endonuclease subunit S [Alistipes putredinis]